MTASPRIFWALLAAVFLAAGALAFSPGLAAGFVSDIFLFLEIGRTLDWATLVRSFLPAGSSFYRPLFVLTVWAGHLAFGMDPLGYHLIAWLAHVASSLALVALALRVTGDRIVAAVAGFALLWSIHAHDVVYDVAAVHHALAGTLLLATVLAWAWGRRALSVALVAVGLLLNEVALLALPMLGWYELCFGPAPTVPARLWQGVRRLVPHVALIVAYFAFRLTFAELPSEGRTCLGPHCLAVAAAEYTNRLLVRPEALIALVWLRRPTMALAALGCAAAVVALVRPWRWRRYTPVVYAAGWVLIAVAYVVLALWPYVADRHLYFADMGFGLVLGCLVSEAIRAARETTGLRRAAPILAIVLIAAWIGVGGPMLRDRGALWRAAGVEAARIVDAIHAALPAPPADAILCVHDAPDSYATTVAPGNTGPYLFRNGLPAALRMRYARPDLTISKRCRDGHVDIWLGGASVRVSPVRR